MIIGTRGSELALKQTEIFTRNLNQDFEVKVVKTLGDKSEKPIHDLGIGAFVKELDRSLICGEIDAAVHSLKDVPVELLDGIEIAAIIERGDVRDCLVGSNLNELLPGAVVGASSERRRAELLSLRKHLKIEGLRGNVPTRIERVGKGYAAIVVAKCALDRLGLFDRAAQTFEIEEMVPAAGQGAIAITTREGEDIGLRKNDDLYVSCMLEREFIKSLGGCKNPVGAYCHVDGYNYQLIGLAYKEDKRVVKEFKGNEKRVTKQIGEWKERFIL